MSKNQVANFSSGVEPEENNTVKIQINETQQPTDVLPDDSVYSKVWWGDLVPREDGSPRTAVRLSDVQFTAGRGEWGSKFEFILSCMGLSVGLGNVWRFPYLAYDNGGSAFLVAYIILQMLVGEAMYFMELCMSQFSGKGPTKMWDMNPAAKGVGISMCIVAANVCVYYSAIMAYTLHFFFSSMQKTLPWTVCKPEWLNCVEKRYPVCEMNWTKQDEPCTCRDNYKVDGMRKCVPAVANGTSAAEFYFYKSVLQLSDGLEPENIGTPIPLLTVCLFLAGTVVVFCLIKGIKSSGKVVYFTVTFPYVILLALLFRGFFLDGSWDGIKYFLVPDWSKLKNVNVWASAAGQMFFSLSVTFGGIIMFGSYNRFNYQVYSDAIFIALMDLATSVLGGLVVFSTFGAMAKILGTSVDHVATSGYGLAFVVYPETLSRMPLTHVWSILFFFMLFTLGLDSEFGLMETVLTCLQDEFPALRRRKSAVCITAGAICFLLGLPCVCPGGDYVVSLMDHYGADFAVLILAFWEVVAVMWGYGVKNVLMDLEYMLGAKPCFWWYWAFCWTTACPGIICFLFLYRMFNYKPLKDHEGDVYPQFAQNIGWFICTYTLLPVPVWFFYLVTKSFMMPDIVTWKQRKKFLFAPNRNWHPNDGRSLPASRTNLA